MKKLAAMRQHDPTASCKRSVSIFNEKNAERGYPIDEHGYPARLVFARKAIQNASGKGPYKLIQEVASAFAAMASIKCVLDVPSLRGWPAKARDAAQAYIQARIVNTDCPKTWFRLPKSCWTASWFTAKGRAREHRPCLPARLSKVCSNRVRRCFGKHLTSILSELRWECDAAHPGILEKSPC